MSRIHWKQAMQPLHSEKPQSYVYDLYDNFDFRIERTAALPLTDDEIVELPDPRSQRALSRAGLLLSAVGLPSRGILAGFLAEDPFSVGLYSAMQDGPEDYTTAKQMLHTPPAEFARTYKSLRTSKQFLRQIGNIQPSLLGIFLGIMGPQYVFSHSRWGCLHALEQAEYDLQNGVVKAALVCSSFSLEDPLISMRIRRSIPESCILSEGAGALVLLPSEEYTDWRQAIPENNERFFGTAHDLVVLASGQEEVEETADQLAVAHADC